MQNVQFADLVRVTTIVSRDTETGVSVVVKEIRCFYFYAINKHSWGWKHRHDLNSCKQKTKYCYMISLIAIPVNCLFAMGKCSLGPIGMLYSRHTLLHDLMPMGNVWNGTSALKDHALLVHGEDLSKQVVLYLVIFYLHNSIWSWWCHSLYPPTIQYHRFSWRNPLCSPHVRYFRLVQ